MTKWIFVLCCCMPFMSVAQGIMRTTYHDEAKKNIKEVYQIRDLKSNIFEGSYISYYPNGNIESKGQFSNNQTVGVWEFYYDTGKLRMKGILQQNSYIGVWEYFDEDGQKSMEGSIEGKQKEGTWKIFYPNGTIKETGEYKKNNRTGLWKFFYDDGVLRGLTEYKDDYGRTKEFDRLSRVTAEGFKSGVRNVGLWRYFYENGTIQSEGNFDNGRKNGEWKQYFPSGKLSSSGSYKNDLQIDQWNYFFDDGKLLSTGEYVDGNKKGFWPTFNQNGNKQSEVTYRNGIGEYREYYDDGKLKIEGQIVNKKNQGKWLYYFADGKKEGECQFDQGMGTYTGFFPDGRVQTKGQIEGDLKVGTWEMYEPNGKLSGYYKPIYDDKKLSNEISILLAKKTSNNVPTVKKIRRNRGNYFAPTMSEYQSMIVGGNPLFTVIGWLPLSVEFYKQERLGFEFALEALRDPFFKSNEAMPDNQIFRRGNVVSLRQKFYNPMRSGMWYFGHQLRFSDIGYFSNVLSTSTPPARITAAASEQRAEWGVLLGIRLMKENDADGFTLDVFGGYNVGYRAFYVDPLDKNYFSSVGQSSFSSSFSFGINFGYSFSFEPKRW